MRNRRVWLLIGLVVAFALAGAGWKWTAPGHKAPATQLAGWSWDGAASSAAQT
jgi:hypothetical protein